MRSTVDQLNLSSDQVLKQLVPGVDKVWLTELAGQSDCGTPGTHNTTLIHYHLEIIQELPYITDIRKHSDDRYHI
jgi:hypothetical protein